MCWKQLFVVAVLVRGSLAAPLFDASVDGFSLSVGVTAAAAVLAIASLVVIALGLADVFGCHPFRQCCGPYTPIVVHSCCAIAWMPIVALGVLLMVRHDKQAAVAFVVSGAVAVLLHAVMILQQCCCPCPLGGWGSDSPKSALLTPQGRGNRVTGESHTAGSSGADDRPSGPVAVDGDMSRNPFRTTYGLLPGSNVMAYQIFLPGAGDEAQAAPYTGLDAGPGRRDKERDRAGASYHMPAPSQSGHKAQRVGGSMHGV